MQSTLRNPKRFSSSEIALLAILAAMNFCHIVDFMIIMPLGPLLMRIFKIDTHQFGLLVSSYTFTAAISGFAASFFLDRFGRKSSLLFFYAGFSIGTVGCGFAPSYETLLFARCFTGAFGGVLASVVLSSVSDAIPYERRGAAMGIIMGAFSVASVVGVPLGLYLAGVYGWHSPFIFVGLICTIVYAFLLLAFPPMRGHLVSGSPRKVTDALFQIKKSPAQQNALFFIFCLILGQFAIIPFLSQAYVENGGLPEGHLSLVYLFGGACSMIASPVVGRLADKYTKHRVFRYSAIGSAVLMIVVTHLSPMPATPLLIISSLFFVGVTARMVPAFAMVSSAATPEFRGGFMSIVSAVQQLAASIASYAAGMVLYSDNSHLFQFEYIGYAAVIFSTLAYLLSFRLPKGQN